MNLTLREEDRRAVDLLLDRSAVASGNGDDHAAASVYATADPSLGERVARTQQLLQLLDWLPAADPSPDLVARTMRFVEDPRAHGNVRSPLPHLLGSQRPVA